MKMKLVMLFVMVLLCGKANAQLKGDFFIIETKPEYPGGINEMFKFLGSHLNTPKSTLAKKVFGVVYIGFTVDTAGQILEPQIKKRELKRVETTHGLMGKKSVEIPIDGDLDWENECLRVIKLMPKWKPSTQQGRPIFFKYTLPIETKRHD